MTIPTTADSARGGRKIHLERWLLVLMLLLAAALLVLVDGPAAGSALPQTTPVPRPTAPPYCNALGREILDRPIFEELRFCPEYLLTELRHASLPAITSIAYAPTCDQLDEPRDWCGALFFVRPDEGSLLWLGAFHADTLTYEVNTFATGLDTPNGLAWHDGAWYVSGGRYVYRLTDDDGDNRADSLDTVIDDLPEGAGFWTGSLGFGPDGRLYVSAGASCNACEESDPRRAAILSYAPDGSGEQVFADGLRHAFDFDWHPASGDLWAADSGHDGLGENLPLDELNRVTEAGQFFGWPFCYQTPDGIVADANMPIADAAFCETSSEPEITFMAHSDPVGMVFYEGAAFPEYRDDLLLVTSGSWNRRVPSGYTLIRVCFDAEGNLETCLDRNGNPVLDDQGNPSNRELIAPFQPRYTDNLERIHVAGQSFYPDHPADIAISPEGWITVSIMEGRLFHLRPYPVLP